MVLLFYIYVLIPFIVLFALGYLPVAIAGRLLSKRPLIDRADAWAPIAGTLGTVVGFLYFGLSGHDRFALADESVRQVWQQSGLAFTHELGQPLFSGLVTALVLGLCHRILPPPVRNSRLIIPVVALLISILCFSLWPLLLTPFL